MAEIFLSYAHDDIQKVEPLVAAIEAAGFTVWWDREISGGERFSAVAEAHLDQASLVVVAWSQAAVRSMWVADEASVGRDKGVLVPISLDGAPPPIGFRQIQVIAFDRWRGERVAPEIDALIGAIYRALEKPPPLTETQRGFLWRRHVAPIAGLAATIVVAAAAALLIGGKSGNARPEQTAPSGTALFYDGLARGESSTPLSIHDARNASYLDERYFRRILRDLEASRRPSDAAILALVENNDIDKAVLSIERRLKTVPGQERIDLLHQIGALSFERDLNKAVAAYEEIVRLDPDDFEALVRLGRAHASQDALGKARSYYVRASAIEQGDDARAKLELTLAIASIDVHLRRTEATSPAIAALLGAIEQANELGLGAIAARAEMLLGLVKFDTGDEAAAKALISSAMAKQKALGRDADRADSLNIMGQIEEKEGKLRAALAYYDEQLEINRRIERVAGVANALYYAGAAHVALDQYGEAETMFAEGARISSENGIADSKFLHLVGLADLAAKRGQIPSACAYIREAEAAYSGESTIGPRTRAVITSIGCAFRPLNIVARSD